MIGDHASLVERATSGDRIAIGSLLEKYLPRLRAFIRLRTSQAIRERESCSDLVQSVCREVLEKLDRVVHRDEAAFRKWLFIEALDKIRDRARYHRAQKRDVRRERRVPGSGNDTSYGEFYTCFLTPSREAIGREDLYRLERAFDELSERHREVITLCRIAGLSHAEVAERLGISKKDVSNAMYRGMRELSWVLSAG